MPPGLDFAVNKGGAKGVTLVEGSSDVFAGVLAAIHGAKDWVQHRAVLDDFDFDSRESKYSDRDSEES